MLFLWKHLIASNVNADEQIHKKTEQNTDSIVGGGARGEGGGGGAGGVGHEQEATPLQVRWQR